MASDKAPKKKAPQRKKLFLKDHKRDMTRPFYFSFDSSGKIVNPYQLGREARTGTIDKELINGHAYFRGRYWGLDDKGIRKRKAVRGKTLAEAEKKLKKAIAEVGLSANVSKYTVERYILEKYLPAKELETRPSTYIEYERLAKAHIIPNIGKVKFTSLTLDNARAWLRDLQKAKPNAKRTVQRAVSILRSAYKMAFDQDEIDRNPIAKLATPKAPPKPQHVLTLDEALRFLQAARETDWFPIFYLAITSSMRQGEIIGLTWDCVDLDAGHINVQKQAARAGKKVPREFSEPKTEASKRRVYLDSDTVSVLKAQRAGQTGHDNPHNLVFPSPRGAKFLGKDNLASRVLPDILAKAKIKRAGVTFHTLRKVGTSLLAANGFSEASNAKRLGHGKRSVTSIYVHAYDTELQKAAAVIGTLFKPLWAKSGANLSETEAA